MSNQAMSEQMANKLKAPQRNNYFFGKLMDVLHFDMETQYFNHQRRLLNRLSVGTGVLCGLDVLADKNKTRVCVTSGAALDALGREIIVPMAVSIDPWKLTNECGQVEKELARDQAHTIHLCLDYNECAEDFMPVLVTDCNTSEQCAPGTIIESFRLSVKEGIPDSVPQVLPDGVRELLVGKAKEEEEDASEETESEDVDSDEAADETAAAADSTESEITTPSDIESDTLEGEVVLDEDTPDEESRKKTSDRYQLLCKALSGVCPEPPKQTCLPLAVIQLLEDGTVGDIVTCSARPTLYSNAQLLEMILCLAERLEECCGKKSPEPPVPEIAAAFIAEPSQGEAPLTVQLTNQSTGEIESYVWDFGNGITSSEKDPAGQEFAEAGEYTISLTVSGPGGESTETQTVQVTKTTLKVTAVEFLNSNEEKFAELTEDDLLQESRRRFSRSDKLAAFRVSFNKAVRQESITSDTLVVEKGNGQAVPGTLNFIDEKTVEFKVTSTVFSQAIHVVTLYGSPNENGEQVTDLLEEALDGEPLSLPSGDDVEGGNFTFSFMIR
mgnify:CR=1 FL=1